MVSWTNRVRLVTYAKRIIARTINLIIISSLLIMGMITINAALKP